MKKLIKTHLLLNLYLLALVQPALPVLDYVINYDYIVGELCVNRDKPLLACNGKCYLEDQVEKTLELDRDPQLPLPPKIEYKKITEPDAPVLMEKPPLIEQSVEPPGTCCNLRGKFHADTLLRPPIV